MQEDRQKGERYLKSKNYFNDPRFFWSMGEASPIGIQCLLIHDF